jgi:hypothetical protein
MVRRAIQAILALQTFTRNMVMQSASGSTPPKRCAYCQEPFYFNQGRIQALPVGDRLVCNEFCAQALREEAHLAAKRAS